MSLRVTSRGSARILSLARPEKRNALSSEVVRALVAEAEGAAADERVRALVVAAEGPVFAAGGDLEEFEGIVDAPDGAARVLEMGERLRALERLPVPVLGAVTGDVFGGGCELLLLLDVVVAEAHAKFAFRHARMGLAPAWGGAVRLVERVGPMEATRLLATGAPFGAEEAARIGFVSEVVPRGDALDRAMAWADEVAKSERDAVAAQKRAVNEVRAALRGDAEAREAAVFSSLWGGPAHRRAMESFARARSPRGAPPRA